MAAIHLQIFLENSSLAWQSWRSSPAHLELTSHGVPTTTCRTVFPPDPAQTHLGCDFLKKYPGEAPRNLVLFGHAEREALPANPSVWKEGGEKKKKEETTYWDFKCQAVCERAAGSAGW